MEDLKRTRVITANYRALQGLIEERVKLGTIAPVIYLESPEILRKKRSE